MPPSYTQNGFIFETDSVVPEIAIAQNRQNHEDEVKDFADKMSGPLCTAFLKGHHAQYPSHADFDKSGLCSSTLIFKNKLAKAVGTPVCYFNKSFQFLRR
jgi:hypothetical protein